jgi:hypothetical protein
MITKAQIVVVWQCHVQCAGSNSKYYPYLSTLPEEPSCGFWMGPDKVAEQLETLFAVEDVPTAVRQLQDASNMYHEVCRFWSGCMHQIV